MLYSKPFYFRAASSLAIPWHIRVGKLKRHEILKIPRKWTHAGVWREPRTKEKGPKSPPPPLVPKPSSHPSLGAHSRDSKNFLSSQYEELAQIFSSRRFRKVTSKAFVRATTRPTVFMRPCCCCCCCCSHINSHNQVRGHRTGSSHSGAEEYPRENHTQPKVVHTYITADAIHASTRNI